MYFSLLEAHKCDLYRNVIRMEMNRLTGLQGLYQFQIEMELYRNLYSTTSLNVHT